MKRCVPYIVNGVLLAAYCATYLSILHQMHVEQRRWPQDADGVDGVTYICTVIPVLGTALLANAGWMSYRIVQQFRGARWTALVGPVASVVVWGLIHESRGYWTPLAWNLI